MLNIYQNIKSPAVLSGTTLEEVLTLIQTNPNSSNIIKARNGELDYNQTKNNCKSVTFNFFFDKYKKDTNIIAATGYLYIDIDNPIFNVETLDLTKVRAMWHSFGGQGWGIILKVDGLTLSNFKTVYINICKELGIIEFIDTNAIKASQFTVISYDTNLYTNPSSFQFNASSYSINDINKNTPPSFVIKKEEEKETITIDGGVKSNPEYLNLRFNNLDEIEMNNMPYVVNWNGIQWVTCLIPMQKLTKGSRTKFLLAYANNFVWLNPNVTKEKTHQVLTGVATIACIGEMTNEINGIIKTIFIKKQEGTLKPNIHKKDRKIVFAKNSGYTRQEKLEICNQEKSEHWKSISTQKLYEIIESWDFESFGKISQSKVIEFHPISKKTIEKYWSKVKEIVTMMNNDFKASKVKVDEVVVEEEIIAENGCNELITLLNTLTVPEGSKELLLQLINDGDITDEETLNEFINSYGKI